MGNFDLWITFRYFQFLNAMYAINGRTAIQMRLIPNYKWGANLSVCASEAFLDLTFLLALFEFFFAAIDKVSQSTFCFEYEMVVRKIVLGG